VVFLRRDLNEVLASQQRMLARRDKAATDTDEALAEYFLLELERLDQWRAGQTAFRFLDVCYHDLLADPTGVAENVSTFLGGGLDTAAMAAVVDPRLYRNRRVQRPKLCLEQSRSPDPA
jgi:hypothetical protein